jgi:hypothetical protein
MTTFLNEILRVGAAVLAIVCAVAAVQCFRGFEGSRYSYRNVVFAAFCAWWAIKFAAIAMHLPGPLVLLFRGPLADLGSIQGKERRSVMKLTLRLTLAAKHPLVNH